MSSRQYLYIVISIFAIVAVISLIIYKKRGKSAFLVFGALSSFLLKLDYVLYTPHWIRQHDVIGFGNFEGQAAYIEWFLKERRLPDFDPVTRWGFFQPPLHHIISAVFIGVQTAFGKNYNAACENVQYLTLLYSMLTLLFAYLIFKEAGLEGDSLIIAFTLSAFHPGFILLSGSINNDCLCELFMVMSLYFALRWYRKSTYLRIIPVALCIGLSMFTKLSGALAAFPVAFIFLAKWIGAKKEGFFTYLKQYLLFAVICIPPALFYPVRNLIRFNTPITYTPPVGEPVYEHSLLSRIFDIRTGSPFVFLISSGGGYDEFNIPLAIMKTSLFGESVLSENEARMIPFAWAALILGAVLALIAVFASVFVTAGAVRKKEKAVEMAYWFISWLVPVIFILNLSINTPYFSSQDFRYIQYVIVMESLFLGLFSEGSPKRQRFLFGLVALFAAASSAVYILLGKP